MAGPGEKDVELRPVLDCLLASLANRLGVAPQSSLTPALVEALGRRLGVRREAGLQPLLQRMGQFGLDIQHIEEDRLAAGDPLHQYFLLDLAIVLLDSIEQVKAARTSQLLRSHLESAAVSSGGEEVSKILTDARKKYGRIRSFRKELDQANISMIQPQRLPAQVLPQALPRQEDSSKSASVSETSDVKDTTDHTLVTKAQPKPKRRKLSKDIKKIRKEKSREKENLVKADEDDVESDHEINVNIPISDTTDVKIMVKPLDNHDLKNQRIHVRVNQKHPSTTTPKSKSRHIVYGSKSVLSHHLRKAKPPLFSRKAATPKLAKKQVLERVVSEVKKERRKVEEAVVTGVVIKPEVDFKMRAQKVLREKRTENANFRKIIGDL